MDHLLFVYGTIRIVNKKNYPVGDKELHERVLAKEAYLDGFKMLHLGSFPGLIEGEKGDRVRGEIHRIPEPGAYDGYEGCHPDDLEGSLYTRKQVSVSIPGGPNIEGVWVYIFNEEHQLHHFADKHVLAVAGAYIAAGDREQAFSVLKKAERAANWRWGFSLFRNFLTAGIL